MDIKIYKSPRNIICNPIVRQISIALLITALLASVILWIFYPSQDIFFIVFFYVIIVTTLVPGVYMLYRSIRSDLAKIHLFAKTSDNRLFYVTVEIPPREVHHARFPENLGFGSVKTTVNDGFKETVDFVYSDGFDQSLSGKINYGEPFGTQRDITVDEIGLIERILPIRGGWVIDFYDYSAEQTLQHAILFKHIIGSEDILRAAEKIQQREMIYRYASDEKKEKL